MSKIISEIGVNWNGDIDIAKEMILESKRAGADFVKFQMFYEDTIKDSPHKYKLSEMILDFSKLNKLRGYAFQNHIGFGVSVMYPEAFYAIRKIGIPVDFIKIRYADHQNGRIARSAVTYCDDYNIPLLVSTKKYIRENDFYRYNIYNTPHVKYLYCIPKYPPELEDIKKAYISPELFEGYSNHYQSKYLPMIAVARNLEFVEIHVKRNNDNTQIDENVSIEFDDLNEVCMLRDILKEMESRKT